MSSRLSARLQHSVQSVESSSYFQALVHRIHFSTQKKRQSPSFTCFSSSTFLNGETAPCDITPSQVLPVSDLPWGNAFLQDGANSGLSLFSGAWKLFSSVGIKTEVHHWVRVSPTHSPARPVKASDWLLSWCWLWASTVGKARTGFSYAGCVLCGVVLCCVVLCCINDPRTRWFRCLCSAKEPKLFNALLPSSGCWPARESFSSASEKQRCNKGFYLLKPYQGCAPQPGPDPAPSSAAGMIRGLRRPREPGSLAPPPRIRSKGSRQILIGQSECLR